MIDARKDTQKHTKVAMVGGSNDAGNGERRCCTQAMFLVLLHVCTANCSQQLECEGPNDKQTASKAATQFEQPCDPRPHPSPAHTAGVPGLQDKLTPPAPRTQAGQLG